MKFMSANRGRRRPRWSVSDEESGTMCEWLVALEQKALLDQVIHAF